MTCFFKSEPSYLSDGFAFLLSGGLEAYIDYVYIYIHQQKMIYFW